MKKTMLIKSTIFIAAIVILFYGITTSEEKKVPPAPNGIELPQGYKDWRLISSSHREDNNTLRVILGNDAAIDAARQGKTNPWPDGVTFAKLVWKDSKHPKWATATVPGDFVHAEFMVKDAKKYAATGGWGFARWLGSEQKPYGNDASFVQECFNCHTPVKDNDYVFTKPSSLP
ncbi:MAG TPA: cytochrome P460 family protein [Thermodesulfovibrionia bacterium]|nr:cytochrome P460 family protein [Thermodesulfovibrionia bacterium]